MVEKYGGTPDDFEPSVNNIRADKAEVLDILRKNREEHRAIFEKAFEVYRERATEELARMLDDAKNGRKIQRGLGLVQPVDYTKEYDRVIKALELSKDDVVYLDQRDLARYVMDDWEWKEAFTSSTAAYLVTGG